MIWMDIATAFFVGVATGAVLLSLMIMRNK